ncbi:MAG: class I SAM-dependent methyltransferase [Acidobacteriota bacterium]
MKEAEFDKYSSNYDEIHRASLGIAGDRKEYFALQKAEALASLLASLPARASGWPERVLEFGCGVGNNLPHLPRLFPGSEIFGCDVSAASLEEAAKAAPGVRLGHVREPGELPLLDAHGFDLILAANVFHHIEATQRPAWMSGIFAALAPGGVLAVFEHNPLNPATRHMVAQCPFDEGAVLLRASEAAALARGAGLEPLRLAYTFPFPFLPALARLAGRLLGRTPLGFQYCLLAGRPNEEHA